MDSPLRVPPDESRGEAEKRISVFSMPLPLINPFPRLYAGIKDQRNANIMRKRQLSQATVYKRLSDFFVCTGRMSSIVYSIL